MGKSETIVIRATLEELAVWKEQAGGVALSKWARGKLNEPQSGTPAIDEGTSVKSAGSSGSTPEGGSKSKAKGVMPIEPKTNRGTTRLDVTGVQPSGVNELEMRATRIVTGVACDECYIVPGKQHRGFCGLGDRLMMRAKEELNGRA